MYLIIFTDYFHHTRTASAVFPNVCKSVVHSTEPITTDEYANLTWRMCAVFLFWNAYTQEVHQRGGPKLCQNTWGSVIKNHVCVHIWGPIDLPAHRTQPLSFPVCCPLALLQILPHRHQSQISKLMLNFVWCAVLSFLGFCAGWSCLPKPRHPWGTVICQTGQGWCGCWRGGESSIKCGVDVDEEVSHHFNLWVLTRRWVINATYGSGTRLTLESQYHMNPTKNK